MVSKFLFTTMYLPWASVFRSSVFPFFRSLSRFDLAMQTLHSTSLGTSIRGGTTLGGQGNRMECESVKEVAGVVNPVDRYRWGRRNFGRQRGEEFTPRGRLLQPSNVNISAYYRCCYMWSTSTVHTGSLARDVFAIYTMHWLSPYRVGIYVR